MSPLKMFQRYGGEVEHHHPIIDATYRASREMVRVGQKSKSVPTQTVC